MPTLAEIRATRSGSSGQRKKRKLNKKEAVRLKKLRGLLVKLKCEKIVQNRSLQTWLTDDEYEGYLNSIEEQKDVRQQFEAKPQQLSDYEALLKKGIFYYNRADGYAGKGSSQAARTFRNNAEAQFERALEHLEECLAADPSLQFWLDRPVDTSPSGDVSPSSPVSMPRVVTSRSLDNMGGSKKQMTKKIRELKMEAVVSAINALKFHA